MAGTGRAPVVMAITLQAPFVMVATRKRAFVIAITAMTRHNGYTTNRTHDRRGNPMTKIILKLVAALAITVGAFTVINAGGDSSSTPMMLALQLLY